MMDYQKCLLSHFTEQMRVSYEETYGTLRPEYASLIEWASRLALENIGNSDMLYHNVDHTLMVSLVGQEILKGKHLRDGGVSPEDWLQFTIGLLCHDIGYVRGVCRNDGDGVYDRGDGTLVELPPGGTDAALTPYHVDRGKLFVRERFGGRVLINVDADRIASFIEMTRFPPPDDDLHRDTKGYGGLLRAADFIGQLGDPNYLRKIPALFYEFEEIGANEKIGYKNPGDMRKSYAKFYWNVVQPYLGDALAYLKVTADGKQWIANLHSHVFEVASGQLADMQ
jgi:hypothetical protein